MRDSEVNPDFEEQIREAVRIPDAKPAFIQRLRGELYRTAVRPEPRFRLRPAWAFGVVALALLIVSASIPGVAGAFKQLFSFVPGIGLVEQDAPLRISRGPVAVVRDGITLTVEQVVVYPGRVDLAYRIVGLPENFAQEGSATCDGKDSYPGLSLPDGTRLEPEARALGGVRTATGYTSGHSYAATIPEEVFAVTFTLECLQEAPLGGAPEDWAVPFELMAAPQNFVLGDPLQSGEYFELQASGEPGIEYSPGGGTLQDDGYHFFFRIAAPETFSDAMAVSPHAMYLVDASGKRIDMINALPWSPFESVDVWEYRSVEKPAEGPLTIVIEGARVYYLAQAAAFEFTPGASPEIGQIWALDQHFTIGGVEISVTSAEMVELEGHLGFEFTVQSDRPQVKISAEAFDMTSGPGYSTWSTLGDRTFGSEIKSGFVYESAVPETLQITFNTLAVQVDGRWILEQPAVQP